MDPIGPNKEMVLEYSVYDALQCGFDEVVFVLRKEFEEAFCEQVLNRFSQHIRTSFVFQDLSDLPPGFSVPEGRCKPWGTGHAVWCARHAMRQAFVAINADDFYGQNAFRNAAWFFSRPAVGHSTAFMMSGFQLANTLSKHGPVARGVCRVDERGMLKGVEEYLGIESFPDGITSPEEEGEARRFTGDEVVSLNFWGLTPQVFPLLEQHFHAFLSQNAEDLKVEFYLPKAISGMLSRSEATVAVLPTNGQWFGVTYKEDKPLISEAVANFVRSGDYPANLWNAWQPPTKLPPIQHS